MAGAILVIVFTALLLVGCEDGSYFDASTKHIKSDFVSRIEATGNDLRLYEFTPLSDPTRQCIFVAGNRKAGLTCWIKATK
jgi:hypothetical protein